MLLLPDLVAHRYHPLSCEFSSDDRKIGETSFSAPLSSHIWLCTAIPSLRAPSKIAVWSLRAGRGVCRFLTSRTACLGVADCCLTNLRWFRSHAVALAFSEPTVFYYETFRLRRRRCLPHMLPISLGPAPCIVEYVPLPPYFLRLSERYPSLSPPSENKRPISSVRTGRFYIAAPVPQIELFLREYVIHCQPFTPEHL